MRLKDILARPATQIKTANAHNNPQKSAVERALEDLQDDVDTSAASAPAQPAPTQPAATKTAAAAAAPATTPVQDLQSLAQKVAADSRAADIAHHVNLGTAMARGFMESMEAYSKLANDELAKTASSLSPEAIELAVELTNNPERAMTRFMQGAAQRKYAALASAEAYNAEIIGLHKEASESWIAGYSAVRTLLAKPQ